MVSGRKTFNSVYLRIVTETPNLGAFTHVLREWAQMHPAPRMRPRPIPAPSTTVLTSTSHNSTRTDPLSTVWTHAPIASYLQDVATEDGTRVSSSSRYTHQVVETLSSDDDDEDSDSRSSDTEGDRQTVDINSDDPAFEGPHHDSDDINENGNSIVAEGDEQPSLGSFAQALRFLAEERERAKLERESTLASSNATITTSDSLESPRRKRRRRRTKQAQRSKSTPRFGLSLAGPDDDHLDADESSSSYDVGIGTSNENTSSTGDAVKLSPKERGRQPRISQPLLIRTSRSVPQLRVAESDDDPKPPTTRMRDLGKKLVQLFPHDRASLRTINYNVMTAEDAAADIVDTRGRSPSNKQNESIIHVFVDQYVLSSMLRNMAILMCHQL